MNPVRLSIVGLRVLSMSDAPTVKQPTRKVRIEGVIESDNVDGVLTVRYADGSAAIQTRERVVVLDRVEYDRRVASLNADMLKDVA